MGCADNLESLGDVKHACLMVQLVSQLFSSPECVSTFNDIDRIWPY